MKAIWFISSFFKTLFLIKVRSRIVFKLYQYYCLKKHERFLRQNSKFYHEIENIENAPIINKKIMMDNIESIITFNETKEKIFQVALDAEESRDFSQNLNQGISVGLSSGTSGNRGVFLASEKERVIWAGNIMAKYLGMKIIKRQRIALFLRANNNLYESLNAKRIKFKFFDIINNVDQYIDELIKFNPSIVVGPPSVLRKIAEKTNGKLPNVEAFISGAEVLDENDAVVIKKNIGRAQLKEIYQCTEGFLAFTCRKGKMHLCEDLAVINKEFIDENRFYPLITDFTRKTQPIIKYKLNDILTLSKYKCDCGCPFEVISRIEGRSDNIFTFYRNNKKIEIYPDFIRRAIITSNDSLEEYQVTQVDNNKIEVSYLSTTEISTKVINSMYSLLNRFGVDDVEVLIVSFTEHKQGQKLQRIKSLFTSQQETGGQKD